jgi:hypothetical protein
LSEQGPRGVQGVQGAQGNQGNQGNRGEQGTAGLSTSVRRAILFLFALNVLLAGANMLWTAHSVSTGNQQRCASIEADATIPLPHPIAGNPSREWEAAFEANAQARARQLHCAGAG